MEPSSMLADLTFPHLLLLYGELSPETLIGTGCCETTVRFLSHHDHDTPLRAFEHIDLIQHC